MYKWDNKLQNVLNIDIPLYILQNFYEHSDKIYPIIYGVDIDANIDDWIQEITLLLQEKKTYLNENNIKVVLYDIFESSKFVKEAANIIQKIIERKIYVVSSDQKLQSNNNITYIFNNYWKTIMPYKSIPIRFTPKKLYINLVRVCRLHRCMLLDSLIEKQLFAHGFNTVSNIGWHLSDYCKDNPSSVIQDQKFDILDVSDLINNNPNNSVPLKQCTKSFVYLATETLTDNTRMFFSEKVYKPIAIGMPFLTLGNVGTLEYLKRQGFKTFSKWFNEDYDLDLSLQDRINIIVENLELYKNMSDLQLIKVRAEMNETCKHNLKIYKKINKEIDLNKTTEDILL